MRKLGWVLGGFLVLLAVAISLGLALFEPSLCQRAIALTAVAITTGVEDGNLGAAMVAAPQVSAERLGSTRDDVGDGAAMGW